MALAPDVAIPAESDGAHGAAANEIIMLALMILVRHAGGRIKISKRNVEKMPDGTLAFAFKGPGGSVIEFVWVRHAPDAPPAAAPLTISPEELEEYNFRFGLSLLVLDAGGRLALPPFSIADMPEGVLTFGSDADDGYLLTLVPHE